MGSTANLFAFLFRNFCSVLLFYLSIFSLVYGANYLSPPEGENCLFLSSGQKVGGKYKKRAGRAGRCSLHFWRVGNKEMVKLVKNMQCWPALLYYTFFCFHNEKWSWPKNNFFIGKFYISLEKKKERLKRKIKLEDKKSKCSRKKLE